MHSLSAVAAVQCGSSVFHSQGNMDLDTKQAARSKHKHSQHLKRLHVGRGRGGSGPSTHHTHGPDLESNYDRYDLLDEEIEHGSGEVVRQSEGADLEQLLVESEQFYAQAHFRYRSLVDTIRTEPPPVDVAALEQELALQTEPLIQALALLPLSELFGIEPEYIQACDARNDIRAVTDNIGKQGAMQQQQVAVQLQQQQVLQKLPPPQQQQQQQLLESRSNVPQELLGSSRSTVAPGATTKRMPAAAQAPVVSAAAQAAASLRLGSSAVDDDDDSVLEQLLTGTTAQQQLPTASQAQRAAASAGISNRDKMPSPWEQAAAFGPAGPPPVGPPPAPAAKQQPVPAAGASEHDDELDELLGLCGATSQPLSTQATTAKQPAAAPSVTKKQSLEDWLDGF